MNGAPRVQSLGDGRFLVTAEDGTQQLAYAVIEGRTAWVFLDGQVHTVTPEAAGPRRREQPSAADDAAALAAPMPASVSAVHVVAGQQVTQGDLLITLEAMKMELPIRAPRDGVIQQVNCSPGELVQPGIQLVEMRENSS